MTVASHSAQWPQQIVVDDASALLNLLIGSSFGRNSKRFGRYEQVISLTRNMLTVLGPGNRGVTLLHEGSAKR